MSREHLWRQLRAAVAAGDTDEANKTAIALGYIDKGMRRRLLETLWRKHQKGARDGA